MTAIWRGWLALLLVACVQPGVRARLAELYDGDDFFTLGPAAGAGLALLSVLLISLLFLVVDHGARCVRRALPGLPSGMNFALCAATGMAVFAGLYLLSPQVFYTYYQLIIPGLPSQIVIAAPEAAHLVRGLSLSADARLAEHLAAAAFWSLALISAWAELRGWWRIIATMLIVAAPMLVGALA